jgi:hypothetical protein
MPARTATYCMSPSGALHAGMVWSLLWCLGHHSHQAVLEAAEQHLPLLLDAINQMAAISVGQQAKKQVAATA